MAVGLMSTYCQRGVQQQYALLRPSRQISRLRHGCTEILLYLLKDVLQRWRKHDAILNGEAQTMSLTGFMVRILANDNHLHTVERTQVEGVEDEFAWRVARGLCVLSSHRLMLAKNVAKIIKSGMSLLGIEVPERM